MQDGEKMKAIFEMFMVPLFVLVNVVSDLFRGIEAYAYSKKSRIFPDVVFLPLFLLTVAIGLTFLLGEIAVDAKHSATMLDTVDILTSIAKIMVLTVIKTSVIMISVVLTFLLRPGMNCLRNPFHHLWWRPSSRFVFWK